jgi:acetyl esterase/lipase
LHRDVKVFDRDRFFAELRDWAEAAAWPVETIQYGAHPAQAADLRLPARRGPHPVCVIVHGGFWRAQFTRANTAALAVDLARRGYATWNIEYRRVGGEGGVPATLEDVGAAVDALAELDTPLDRSRVLAVGHSAGGHLALWLAGTGKIAAALSLAGICDLTDAAREGLGGRAAVELAGGTPEERPDAYDLADPMLRLPTGIPQLLVHGDADDRVPVEQSRRYARAARVSGDRCELLELPEVGHFELVDPRHVAWTRVVAHLERLC